MQLDSQAQFKPPSCQLAYKNTKTSAFNMTPSKYLLCWKTINEGHKIRFWLPVQKVYALRPGRCIPTPRQPLKWPSSTKFSHQHFIRTSHHQSFYCFYYGYKIMKLLIMTFSASNNISYFLVQIFQSSLRSKIPPIYVLLPQWKTNVFNNYPSRPNFKY